MALAKKLGQVGPDSRHRCVSDIRQLAAGVEIVSGSCADYAFPVHVHEGYTFGRVMSGSESLNIRGVSAQAGPGTLYYYHSDEAHSGQSIDHQGWTYQSLYIVPSALSRILDLESDEGLSFANPVLERAELSAVIGLAFSQISHNPCLVAAQSALHAAVRASFRYNGNVRQVSAGLEKSAISRVKDIIRSEFTQALSLDQLATIADLHPGYLIEAFKRAEGITPHAYLVARRVAAAQSQLSCGAKPAHVANDCGFFDQSHLNRHFKRITGMTPRAYALASEPG
jgi:AraC-like DNA-binding protein